MRIHRATHAQRGNALVETALTISLVLMVFLGLIKLSLVSYEQAEADGVAFIAAHAASLTTTGQQDRARTKVAFAFPSFPTNNVLVPPGSSYVTSTASIVAGGLFPWNGFGNYIGGFNMQSSVVEPVAKAAPVAGSVFPFNNLKATFTPLNCTSVGSAGNPDATWTSNNAFNPAVGGISCASLTLAKPGKDPKNPFAPYACRLAYYASLTTSGDLPGGASAPQLSDITSSKPYYFDPSGLKDGNGNSLQQEPWPPWYQNSSDTCPDKCGVNSDSARGSGIWFTNLTDSKGHVDNSRNFNVGGGLLGSQLTPIFAFLTDTTGNAANDPCPSA